MLEVPVDDYICYELCMYDVVIQLVVIRSYFIFTFHFVRYCCVASFLALLPHPHLSLKLSASCLASSSKKLSHVHQ